MGLQHAEEATLSPLRMRGCFSHHTTAGGRSQALTALFTLKLHPKRIPIPHHVELSDLNVLWILCVSLPRCECSEAKWRRPLATLPSTRRMQSYSWWISRESLLLTSAADVRYISPTHRPEDLGISKQRPHPRSVSYRVDFKAEGM